jgi:membrane protease YdiL (CAAX protease family)
LEATPSETNDTGLAPPWHTAALVVLMVSVAVVGTIQTRSGAAVPVVPTVAGTAWSRVVSTYVPMVLVQWSLLVYVARVGRPKSALTALLGPRWPDKPRWKDGLAVDGALAASGWVLVEAMELWLARGSARTATMRDLLPQSGLDRAAWTLVAVSAGFCEEVVYRGYLQRQLAAFFKRPALGVVLQAVLFGVAHGAQGGSAALRAAAYGAALGMLAAWRQSLRPGIICHVVIDLTALLQR